MVACDGSATADKATLRARVSNIDNVVCKVFNLDRLAMAVLGSAFPQLCGMHVPRQEQP